MANNNLSLNTTEKLIRAFVPAFDSQRLLSKTITTSLQNLVTGFDPNTGRGRGLVRQKKPPQFFPQRTDDGDFSAKEKNPVKVGSVPAEVGQYITVFMEYTDVETALEAGGVQLDELVNNAAIDMVNTLELDLASRMFNEAALMTGDPTKALATWDAVAAGGTLINSIGLPAGRKFMQISNHQATALASEQKGLAVNPEVGSAWANATIASRYAGIDSVYQSDSCHVYESGDINTGITVKTKPVQTYDALMNETRMTIVLTATGSEDKVLKAGTPLVFETNLVHFRNRLPIIGEGGQKVSLTLSVVEDATFNADGDATVIVSGQSIFGTGVDSAFNTVGAEIKAGSAVSVKPTNSTAIQGAMCYHESFYGMGSVQLQKLKATDSRFETTDGISIRVTEVGEALSNKHQLRLDILPTFACLNGFAGCKVFG